MHIGFKALIGVGSLGAIGGTSVAIHHFSSGESIENYLTKTNKNKVFLSSNTPDLTTILNIYESSQRIKPQDAEGKSIAKDELIEWCKEAIKGKYYGAHDNTFKAVDSWCYINTKSFAEQININENKKLSEKQSTDKEWTDAWNNYKTGRNDPKLKITYQKKQTDLNGTVDTKGAEALMEWCKEKTSVKLYVDNAEEEFTRFNRWCPKVDV